MAKKKQINTLAFTQVSPVPWQTAGLQLGDDANHRHLWDVAIHVCVNEVENTPQPGSWFHGEGRPPPPNCQGWKLWIPGSLRLELSAPEVLLSCFKSKSTFCLIFDSTIRTVHLPSTSGPVTVQGPWFACFACLGQATFCREPDWCRSPSHVSRLGWTLDAGRGLNGSREAFPH